MREGEAERNSERGKERQREEEAETHTERDRGREEMKKRAFLQGEICVTNMDSQSCGLTIFFTLFNTRDYLSHSA